MNYAVSAQASNVFKIEMSYKAGWQQPFLLMSDVHFDNPDCNRKLLKNIFHYVSAKIIVLKINLSNI